MTSNYYYFNWYRSTIRSEITCIISLCAETVLFDVHKNNGQVTTSIFFFSPISPTKSNDRLRHNKTHFEYVNFPKGDNTWRTITVSFSENIFFIPFSRRKEMVADALPRSIHRPDESANCRNHQVYYSTKQTRDVDSYCNTTGPRLRVSNCNCITYRGN